MNRVLASYEPDWSRQRLALAKAIARIDTRPVQKAKAIRVMLEQGTTGESAVEKYAWELNHTIDLIVEIGDEAAPVIPDLVHMVETQELLHPARRLEAAYALARLQPEVSRWRDYVVRWAEFDSEERLQQLDKKVATDPK